MIAVAMFSFCVSGGLAVLHNDAWTATWSFAFLILALLFNLALMIHANRAHARTTLRAMRTHVNRHY
jgi:hypothetical protein